MSTKARTAVVIQAACVLLAVGVGAGAAQAGALDIVVGDCPRGCWSKWRFDDSVCHSTVA